MLDGELRHEDSLGNGSVIGRGDVQRMTAGSGIVHSEYNASSTNPAHLLQIWIVPERVNLHPDYEDKRFDDSRKQGRWCLIASHDGRGGSLTVHQDIALYATLLEPGTSISYEMSPGRTLYVQIARGNVCLSGTSKAEEVLLTGDAAMVEMEQIIHLQSKQASEVLVFDLPVSGAATSLAHTH